MLYNKIPFTLPVLLLVGLLLAACSNNPQAAQDKIEKIARNMRAELPKMLDRDTRLVNVYTKDLELVSEYELVHYKPDAAEDKKVKSKIASYLKIQVCPGIKKEMLSRGISSRYIYKDGEGRIIGDWLIAPGVC